LAFFEQMHIFAFKDMSNSRNQLLVLLMVITSLIGYLEWGGGNKAFLFELENEVIRKLFTSPKSALHPFTVLPILGQVLLLTSLFRYPFQPKPVYWGIGFIGILIIFILLIGIISFKWKVILCALPFVFSASLFIYFNRK